MTVDERYVRVSARTAEAAYLEAKAWGGAAGSALDAGVILGAGPAVVGALDELGPVLVAMPLAGSTDAVAAAAGRLARFGAAWVTVAALAGSGAMRAAVAAVSGTGCRVAAETVPVGLDDAATAALLGSSRGKLVARLAAAAAGAGVAGAVCAISDLGVIAQVAPALVRIAADAGPKGDWGQAEAKGAGVLVLPDAGTLHALGGGSPGAVRRRT